MSSALRYLAPTLAVGLALALGACGGSDDPETPPPADESSAASGPSNEQDTSRVKLTQCLREQGLDVPDTEGTAGSPS